MKYEAKNRDKLFHTSWKYRAVYRLNVKKTFTGDQWDNQKHKDYCEEIETFLKYKQIAFERDCKEFFFNDPDGPLWCKINFPSLLDLVQIAKLESDEAQTNQTKAIAA